jgi:hypothetical protein
LRVGITKQLSIAIAVSICIGGIFHSPSPAQKGGFAERHPNTAGRSRSRSPRPAAEARVRALPASLIAGQVSSVLLDQGRASEAAAYPDVSPTSALAERHATVSPEHFGGAR